MDVSDEEEEEGAEDILTGSEPLLDGDDIGLPEEPVLEEFSEADQAELLDNIFGRMETMDSLPQGSSKMKPSSILQKPPDKGKAGGERPPRAQRIQKSYIVRNVKSKYATEIETAPRDPLPLSDNVSEPLKSFLALLRSYMGHDPASADVQPVVERLLRSTKAPDESDSEHFQRLMAAWKTLTEIDRSRVYTLQTLIELAQKDTNDDRQHARFTDAIAIKRDKANSEIARDDVAKKGAEYELGLKKLREDYLGYLSREVEAKEARCKIALLNNFPDRPMTYKPPQKSNFDRRMMYLWAYLK